MVEWPVTTEGFVLGRPNVFCSFVPRLPRAVQLFTYGSARGFVIDEGDISRKVVNVGPRPNVTRHRSVTAKKIQIHPTPPNCLMRPRSHDTFVPKVVRGAWPDTAVGRCGYLAGMQSGVHWKHSRIFAGWKSGCPKKRACAGRTPVPVPGWRGTFLCMFPEKLPLWTSIPG